MNAPKKIIPWKSFIFRTILPTVLTIILFLSAIFFIIIPAIEKNSLDRKREMIRELTNSAWNILAKFENDVKKKILTREEAGKFAVEQIKNLHYGRHMKDYFWINDMHPRMVIHPYRTDLNGKDLTDFTDPSGKKVFIEFVNMVRQNGSGYVEYMWQWKDDKTRIVPKISYVKGFKPWGWIIGTGIYIEDVNAEIALITRNIIKIALVILFIMSSLLVFIIYNNYRSEKQRGLAELSLRESEKKYRTLVESSSEGMLMAVEGSFIYSNRTIANFLEYNQAEFGTLKLHEIFDDDKTIPQNKETRDLIAGKSFPENFEARLRTKTGKKRDVILSASEIFINGKPGFIAVVTDITKRKKAEDELGQSEKKYRTIVNNLNVGIYRKTIGKNARVIEVNPAMVTLFGCESKNELLSSSIKDFYVNPDDHKKFEEKAIDGKWEREIISLKKKDGTIFYASIWSVTVYDKKGRPKYYDGIIEDVTEKMAKEKGREKILFQLQNAMSFPNISLGSLPLEDATSCHENTTVYEAVELLNSCETDVLLIKDKNKDDVGVLTDIDFRKNIAGGKLNMDRPVSDIMSSPVISLPAGALIFEAGLAVKKQKISHMFVTDRDNKIAGVVRSDDITSIKNYSPAILLQEIQSADSSIVAAALGKTVPHLITTLINSGADISYINHLTTMIADTILQKFIGFAMDELGSAPARFSFLVFGSGGRKEQTLSSDQDNAIIYEDVADGIRESAHEYFFNLGKKVCTWLDDAGYPFCDGNNMAENPRWCRPLSVWKKYFTSWIAESSAQDLLQLKIFFDFKTAYGYKQLGRDLRDHLNRVTARHPAFFQYLSRNILRHSPPISIFGNIMLENIENHGKVFDIKSAMMPIADFARIYALRHQFTETNTVERLQRLHEKGILSKQNFDEMIFAFNHLMQVRLKAQAEDIVNNNNTPDNYVNPANLTYIEKIMLKEIFSQTKHFQARLSYDFTGRIDSGTI